MAPAPETAHANGAEAADGSAPVPACAPEMEPANSCADGGASSNGRTFDAPPRRATGTFRAARSRTFAALANPGFRRYYLGQGISLVGTWLQSAAVSWLVFDQTGSEFMLGVVQAAALMPGTLFGLVAGALADRIAPRKMIVLMQFGQMMMAALLAVLVALGQARVWQMAAILAVARICVTFERTSRQVFFFDLVGPETLSNAIALNSGLFNAARVLGPTLAGVCLTLVGAAGCFTLDAFSYVAAIVAVMSIQVPPRVQIESRARFSMGEVLGGIRYLGEDRRILAFILLVTFFGVTGMGYDAMISAYTRRVLGAGVEGYSILLACSGAGATLAAVIVASLGAHRRRERWAIGGMLVFSVFLGVGAVLPRMLVLAGLPGLRLAAASVCLLGVGFGAVVFYSSCLTVIQLDGPDHLRGRLMGIWMIVYSASVPLGALWTGRAAVAWGVASVMAFSAVLCAIAGVFVLGSGVLDPRHADRKAF